MTDADSIAQLEAQLAAAEAQATRNYGGLIEAQHYAQTLEDRLTHLEKELEECRKSGNQS